MKKAWLLTMACVGLFALPAHAEDVGTPIRSISVSAEAEVKVKPNKADVFVTLQEQAPKMDEAKRKVDAQLKSLLEIAKELGIPEKDLRTTYTTIQPIYRYEENRKRVFEGYTVAYSVQVTLKEIDRVGVFIEKVLAADIDEIGNVQYSMQEEDTAREEALQLAAVKAKRKAEVLAKAMGEVLGGVMTITEGSAHIPQPIPMMKAMAMESAGMADAVSPPPGEISIVAQIQARFELK